MSRSVRIPDWAASAACRAMEGMRGFIYSDARAAIVAALKPKKSTLSYSKRKAVKKRSKREETAEIRAAVFERANGLCECGCGLAPNEMDHFWGKGKARQSVENCWALSTLSHRLKTQNSPSAAAWLENFARHCNRHGYSAEASRARRRLEALELVEKAAEVGQS